jgi:hypothetical protein
MDENKLIRIPLNKYKETCVFICMLTSFYSHHFRELLLNIPDDNHNHNHESLIYIIKRLITRYYYENKGNINFYKTITPEILLLKFLNETNYIKIRRFMVLNKKMEVPLTFLCDIHHSLNLNCLKIITINDNPRFYLNTNNYYSYNYNNDTKEIEFNLNNNTDYIEDDIKKTFERKIDIIMIQKENRSKEADITQQLISNRDINERSLNLNRYDSNHDGINTFKEIILLNNSIYKLDSCIIRETSNENYLILFHFNKKKYLYNPSKNNMIEYDWTILMNFDYTDDDNNNYNFHLSPSLITTYTII